MAGKKLNILLLEDDSSLGIVLQEHLQMHGYNAHLFTDGEQGSKAVKENNYDLCLVDVMMPKKDGFEFVRDLRATNKETPVIFLTARSLKEDRIEGFKVGCDDYITKPFSIEELMLRINAVLRRTSQNESTQNTISQFDIGSYNFDSDRRILKNKSNEVKLTPKEADLLRMLCLNKNRILERDIALREIWGNDNYFSGRSMDVFISRLRKYLKDDSTIEILGVHGKGFRLIVESK